MQPTTGHGERALLDRYAVSPRLGVQDYEASFIEHITTASCEERTTMPVFRVCYQATAPSPSWSAWKERTKGRLIIEDQQARFVPDQGGTPVALDGVFRVALGYRNSRYAKPIWVSLVDTWVEVLYGDPRRPQIAYLNDSRWFGMGVYLRHGRLIAALNTVSSA